MQKNRLLLILMVTILVGYFIIEANDSDYYEYALRNSDGSDVALYHFSNSSVARYPGWRYRRNGVLSVELWYPSRIDKDTYNMWISNKEQKLKAEQKPNENEKRLLISIDWSYSIQPDRTLDSNYRYAYCLLNGYGRNEYIFDGEVSGYKRYILDSPGSARLSITYLPIEPVQGIYCMTCIENANCSLHGFAEPGINYRASFEEKSMPDAALDVHEAVGKFLNSKRIKWD